MAPEMIKGQAHNECLDIWCLGILLYEMLHGYAPFKGKGDKEKCANILRNTGVKFDPSLSKEAVDLIKQILKTAPVDRISMNGIFNHPWMKKFEKHYKIDLSNYIASSKTGKQKIPHQIISHLTIEQTTKRDPSFGKEPSSLKDSGCLDSGSKPKAPAKIITIEDDRVPLCQPNIEKHSVTDKPPLVKPKQNRSRLMDLDPSKEDSKPQSRYINEKNNFDVDKYLKEKNLNSQSSLGELDKIALKDKKAKELNNSKGEINEGRKVELRKLDNQDADDEGEFRPMSFGEKENSNKGVRSLKRSNSIQKQEPVAARSNHRRIQLIPFKFSNFLKMLPLGQRLKSQVRNPKKFRTRSKCCQ